MGIVGQFPSDSTVDIGDLWEDAEACLLSPEMLVLPNLSQFGNLSGLSFEATPMYSQPVAEACLLSLESPVT